MAEIKVVEDYIENNIFIHGVPFILGNDDLVYNGLMEKGYNEDILKMFIIELKNFSELYSKNIKPENIYIKENATASFCDEFKYVFVKENKRLREIIQMNNGPMITLMYDMPDSNTIQFSELIIAL